MIIYFVIDISASMTGAKMSSLNDAMENLVGELGDYDSVADPLSFMVLLYSRDIRWLSNMPIPLKEFVWERPTPYGMTAMGKACSELSNKIGKDRSIALIMTDGYPTDDFESGIKELESNPNLTNCTRLAMAIGDDADLESLGRFVGYTDNVYSVNSMDKLSLTLSNLLQSNISRNTTNKYLTMNDEWD